MNDHDGAAAARVVVFKWRAAEIRDYGGEPDSGGERKGMTAADGVTAVSGIAVANAGLTDHGCFRAVVGRCASPTGPDPRRPHADPAPAPRLTGPDRR
ncbi:hypothetical protein [Streptomyces humi]